MSAIEFVNHPYKLRILFVTNAKEWREQCEWYHHEIPYPRTHNAAAACLHTKGGGRVILVMVNRAWARRAPRYEAAEVCAHEATHIMRYTCEHVSDSFLGDEAEACLVGALTAWLWRIVIDGAVN